MNKVSITKEFFWDMAHILSDYRGLCRNLHGHTYRMKVKISSTKGLLENTLHSDGMIMDFSDLKKIVQKVIIEPIDHAFMYWSDSNDPVEHQIAEILKNNGKKIVSVNYKPTAEEMALDFFARLTNEFESSNIIVENVKIWETPTSYAEISREN